MNNNVNNYWNVFASSGAIEDYMSYKKIEQLNKVESIDSLDATSSIRSNSEELLRKK